MSGIQENQKTNPTSSEINLLQQENSLDLGVHLIALVFPTEVQSRITTYLVERGVKGNSFSIRPCTAERLRRPVLREVITETLMWLDSFKQKYPALAAKYLDK
jgi:hypothetical protein